ncbi:MAG: hypothetical protein MMC23_006944 [Stictis urceolatum]|nr:hypothetical protein [Stictis urceolata]
MPVYLLHGFRWPRSKIRVHIILNNVDDAAPEYIFSPSTTTALLHSLSRLYPDTMKALPRLRFIEQYDPDDTSGSASSQPFAFVADKVERCELSLDVVETMNQGVDSGSWDALMDLKEHLAPEEKMGWWIVFNGDELRLQDSDSADDVDFNSNKTARKAKEVTEQMIRSSNYSLHSKRPSSRKKWFRRRLDGQLSLYE